MLGIARAHASTGITSLMWVKNSTHQPSRVSLLELRQNNLSNPEAYSEPCKTSKINLFCEDSQWMKTINIFC